MNTKQFQYVLTLAHERSFSKAADVLNITQPALSQYIKKIENEVGLPLFDRTNSEVRITDAGMVYIETARKILDLEHQMDSSLSDLAGNRAGSVIIGAAPYRAAGMLPQAAKAFQKLHPGMHLIIREGTTAELAEGMEHGEYDLALTLMPVDGRIFQWEKLLEEELILAVPGTMAAFPAVPMDGRKYPAMDAALLDGQTLVLLTETQYMRRQLHALLTERKIRIKIGAVVKSLEAQIEMVKAGIGMALVPSGIERFCGSDEVTFYSFRDELPKREVVVMWRRDGELSKAAEELKDILHTIKW